MTPICSKIATVSRRSLASSPSGSSQPATISDAKAPPGYGKLPVLICAPR